ncbi:MAG: hypothetical protein HXX11_20815 [Desulfuromonadales bacterium]|nr:hypothetical protein [Desulfuromonadales bacterium]
MVESKLIVGEFTRFRIPRESEQPTHRNDPDDQTFVIQDRKGFQWGNTPFLWLHYFPGQISEIELHGGEDVLSGEFSGCWMVVYRKGGAIRVGHIGTTQDPKKDLPLKEAWTKFAFNASPDDLIIAVNPLRSWLGNPPPRAHNDVPPDFKSHLYCFVTSTCRCFAVWLYPQQNDPTGGATRRIAAKQEIIPIRGISLRELFKNDLKGTLGWAELGEPGMGE